MAATIAASMLPMRTPGPARASSVADACPRGAPAAPHGAGSAHTVPTLQLSGKLPHRQRGTAGVPAARSDRSRPSTRGGTWSRRADTSRKETLRSTPARLPQRLPPSRLRSSSTRPVPERGLAAAYLQAGDEKNARAHYESYLRFAPGGARETHPTHTPRRAKNTLLENLLQREELDAVALQRSAPRAFRMPARTRGSWTSSKGPSYRQTGQANRSVFCG